jgi:hypothetical protein
VSRHRRHRGKGFSDGDGAVSGGGASARGEAGRRAGGQATGYTGAGSTSCLRAITPKATRASCPARGGHSGRRPRPHVRFCAELPNELWQSDVTCWREAEIMGVIDDHSRLCVVARAFAQVRAPDRREHVLGGRVAPWPAGIAALRQRRGLYRRALQRALCDRVRAGRARHPLQALAPLSPADLPQGRALPPDAQEAPGGAAPGSLATAAAGADRPLHRLLQRGAPAPRARAGRPPRPTPRASRPGPKATVTHQRATTGSATTGSTPAAPSRCAIAAACVRLPWGGRTRVALCSCWSPIATCAC